MNDLTKLLSDKDFKSSCERTFHPRDTRERSVASSILTFSQSLTGVTSFRTSKPSAGAGSGPKGVSKSYVEMAERAWLDKLDIEK